MQQSDIFIELDQLLLHNHPIKDLVDKFTQQDQSLVRLQIEFYLKSKLIESNWNNYPIIVRIFEICNSLLEIHLLIDQNLMGNLMESYFEIVPSENLTEALVAVLFNSSLVTIANKNRIQLLALRIVNRALKRIAHFKVEESALLSIKLASFLPISDRSGVNLRGDICIPPLILFITSSEPPAIPFGTWEVERVIADVKDEINTSHLLSFYNSLSKIFNLFMINVSLISDESEISTMLKVFDTLLAIFANFNFSTDCSCSLCSMNCIPPNRIDFDLFQSLISCSFFVRFILTTITFFIQTLLDTKELTPPTATHLSASLQVACEARLPGYLSKFFSLIGQLFGDTYCHNIKLALYSDKCRLKWKLNSCPSYQHNPVELPTDFSLFTEQIENEKVQSNQSILQGKDFGSPLLNNCWSSIKHPSIDESTGQAIIDIPLVKLKDLIEEYKKDPSIVTSNMMFIWKCSRLLRESTTDFTPFFTLDNPISEFDQVLNYYIENKLD